MRIYLFAAITILFSTIVFSQSNINPDISLIGTFNTNIDLTNSSPDKGKIIFENPSLELFIDGYLNPYARATGDIAYEDGEFSVEELYANIVRGLPLDVQIKAGKYLVGLGQLNLVHPHAWAFVGRPLFHQVFFGKEGFNDIGFDFSFILPTTSFYSTLDVGIFKGDAIGKNEVTTPDDQESIAAHRGKSPVFVGRLGTFFELGDYSNVGIGFNGSYGVHEKVNYIDQNFVEINKSLTYAYIGLDFKYKFRPDDYTALTIQGEGMLNHRNVIQDGGNILNTFTKFTKSINTYGAFVYLDYLFDKSYSFGLKYDYTNGIVDDTPAYNTLSNDDQNSTQGITTWFGYYPIEETLTLSLNLQHLFYNYADGTSRDGSTSVTLQIIFSLGPHKAHPF